MLAFRIYAAFMIVAGVVEIGAATVAISEHEIAIGVTGLLIALIGVPVNTYLARKIINLS